MRECPRRVLMTADTVGGVWTYALDLVAALQPHGVRVALATMGKPLSEAQRAQVARLPNLHVYDSAFKLEWMQNPWNDVARAGEWLLQLAREVRPDVVHLNGYAHGHLPFGAPTVMVAHSCVLSWWKAVHGCAAPHEWKQYREQVARGLHAADEIVAPSKAMLDTLAENYGVQRGRVIWNGRDQSLYRPRPKEPLVLAVGRLWDEAKNVGALGRIADRLSWPVFVAGEEQSPDGASQALGRVRPLGLLAPAQLAEWFGKAAIYALPARYEPFGLSAVEAALSGCALVLGDIPSLREVWGDAAIFVPPDDGEALLAAIEQLVADRAPREHLARLARERALQFTTTRMAQGYVDLYCALAQRKRATGESLCAP